MTQPHFRTLSRGECEQILSRNHVGRLAYAWKNHVDIEPLHYVLDRAWLYGRTSAGTKIDVTGQQWWPVAFEVDELEGLFQWRSVVVHGGFYVIPEEGAEWHEAVRTKGLEVLRTLIPETFTAEDPAPQRTLLFRISVQEIEGREATPGER
jgi:uncharacterized protein